MTDRQAYIDGLRQLAHILETQPDVPLPSTGTEMWNSISIHPTDVRGAIAAINACGCDKDYKSVGDYHVFRGRIASLHVAVMPATKVLTEPFMAQVSA